MLLPNASLLALSLLAASGALASEPALPADAPTRLDPGEPGALGTEQQLREEFARLDGARPSAALIVPGAIAAGGGLAALLAAGVLNIDIRSCPVSTGGSFSISVGFNINCRGAPHRTNPLTGLLLGAGAGGLALGVGALVAVAVVRRYYGRRLDRLEAALGHFELIAAR